MGDFNITPENHHLKHFTDSNDFETKIKEPACFKSFWGKAFKTSWPFHQAGSGHQ